MAVYMVGYDLNSEGKDYSGIKKVLKEYPKYWHHLDSTWLIKTDETPSQIVAKLKPHIDDNDSLLVIEVENSYQGWLTEKAFKWIENAFKDS